jgi:hypothetical protein
MYKFLSVLAIVVAVLWSYYNVSNASSRSKVVAVVMRSDRFETYQKEQSVDRDQSITFVPVDVASVNTDSLKAMQADAVILWKLTDMMSWDQASEFETRQLAGWKGLVLESIQKVSLMRDRKAVVDFLINLTQGAAKHLHITVPKTIVHSRNAVDSVTYPAIMKSANGSGDDSAHSQWYLHEKPTDEWFQKHGNVILQEFIPHGNFIYKVQVIGDKISIDPRPGVVVEARSFAFHTQSLRRPATDADKKVAYDNLNKVKARILEFSKLLSSQLSLNIFGWDFLIAQDSDQVSVFDLNSFPNYRKTNVFDPLSHLIAQKLKLLYL